MTTERATDEKGQITRFLLNVMERLMPIWDRLIIFEPERWIVAFAMVAAGQAAVHSSKQAELFWHVSYNFGIFVHYLAICLLMASGGVMRQLSRKDKAIEPGPGKRLSDMKYQGRGTEFLAWGLLAGGLGGTALSGPLAVLYGTGLFFISGGIEWITGRRDRPVKPLRMLEYTGMALLLLLLGWEAAAGSYTTVWVMMTPYMSAAIAVIILLVMEPFEPVSEAAVVNARSTYGWVLLMVSTALVIISIFTGYSNRDPVISTAAIIALPFYIIAIIYRRPGDLSRAIRYSIIMLIIFVGARYPVIYISILAIYYPARFYYAHRYGLGFPAFAPESDA